MPMTARQLGEATADYDPFIDGDEIVAVERVVPGTETTCDICGHELATMTPSGYLYRYEAKQLVIVPNTGVGWIQGSAAPRHYRLLVCRRGTSCRKRRLEQIQRSELPVSAS